MLHIADPKEIRDGKMTDVYFVRTMQVLKAKKIDKWVKAEFIAKRFPEDYGWGVLAGIEETADLLRDLKVSVRAMKEGTIFRAYEPVMEMEGMYSDFGIFETSILGLLCQASGVATKAARCKKAAGDRRVVSFGARRIHPGSAMHGSLTLPWTSLRSTGSRWRKGERCPGQKVSFDVPSVFKIG